MYIHRKNLDFAFEVQLLQIPIQKVKKKKKKPTLV